MKTVNYPEDLEEAVPAEEKTAVFRQASTEEKPEDKPAVVYFEPV